MPSLGTHTPTGLMSHIIFTVIYQSFPKVYTPQGLWLKSTSDVRWLHLHWCEVATFTLKDSCATVGLPGFPWWIVDAYECHRPHQGTPVSC